MDAAPPIDTGAVDVWRVDCTPSPAALHRARRLVGDEELATAGRLRSAHAGERRLLAHGAVRLLLARTLGLEPRALRFARRCGECGAVGHGKPYLDGPAAAPQLDFSLSHTGDVALVAIALQRRVGVDVERVERAGDPALAPEFLAATEMSAIASLAPLERAPATARSWTRKEAFLKGHGRGITCALRALDMQPLCRDAIRQDGLDAGDGVAAAGVALGSGQRPPWRIVTLDPWPGHVAALAAQGTWRARRWTLAVR